MDWSLVYLVVTLATILVTKCDAGNVLIFTMFTKSQLLGSAHMASLLADAGHNVTIITSIADKPDISTSIKYNILYYNSHNTRIDEERFYKQATHMGHKAIHNINMTIFLDITRHRCQGLLFDVKLQNEILDLKPDVAIVAAILPCPIAFLRRHSIPFLDFCLYTMCSYPHRIPSPTSYVHDVSYEDMYFGREFTFMNRVLSLVSSLITPWFLYQYAYQSVSQVVLEYQLLHRLPIEDIFQLRSKASFVLIHGDTNFEEVRPSLPKVVYIGGINCRRANPLTGDFKLFVESAPTDGVVLFTLGGMLDTGALGDGFIELFLDVFKNIPHHVIWKLNNIPKHLQSRVPVNVKIVDWLPQQDILAHPKTKLFISHGGLQGTFEAICHGVPVYGLPMINDQFQNMRILERKGMAVVERNAHQLNKTSVEQTLNNLLSGGKYSKAAQEERKRFKDQLNTPTERFLHTVWYTIRHKGALHLTSHLALNLHWFKYYQCDVILFLVSMSVLLLGVGYIMSRNLLYCCIFLSGKLRNVKGEKIKTS